MHHRLLTVASVAGLLTLVACRPPAEPTPLDAPPPPAPTASLPGGQPCEELQRHSFEVTADQPAAFDLALSPNQVYVIYATPESDTVSPQLTARVGTQVAESTHALANRRYAAVALAPRTAGQWTIEVGCDDDHGGMVSVRVVQAGSIRPDQQVTGRLASFSDYGFYLADVNVGNRYQATTDDPGTTSDTLLSLRSVPGLAEHTSSDDLGEKNLKSTLTWTAPIDSRELLCVTAATPGGAGSFTLRVKQLPSPVG